MCFSNLPIEFDDEGNPYLAAAADEVDGAPGTAASGCGCSTDGKAIGLDEADPESAYEAIMATMPGDVREQVDGPEDSLDDRDRPAAAEGE